LGLYGALTNGVMRDLGDMEKGFQVIAGSIGPSHGFVHVVDIDQPVSICGLDVRPGDLVHADRHGAVVVPADVVERLEAAIDKLLASERVILEPARAAGFDISTFETAWAAFERARV
jgi:regulator of RNase E activity RraA